MTAVTRLYGLTVISYFTMNNCIVLRDLELTLVQWMGRRDTICGALSAVDPG